ncbi:hypothetical protein HanIR_Chr10g0486901 [Helianthus annuus]|nr:hypothetical protein HanIR_Chr10g0486901 [Helianthus annuus]
MFLAFKESRIAAHISLTSFFNSFGFCWSCDCEFGYERWIDDVAVAGD